MLSCLAAFKPCKHTLCVRRCRHALMTCVAFCWRSFSVSYVVNYVVVCHEWACRPGLRLRTGGVTAHALPTKRGPYRVRDARCRQTACAGAALHKVATAWQMCTQGQVVHGDPSATHRWLARLQCMQRRQDVRGTRRRKATRLARERASTATHSVRHRCADNALLRVKGLHLL